MLEKPSLPAGRYKKGIYLLPSMLTLTNLLLGFYGIILAFKGRYKEVVILIFIASLLDFLDGRLARFTQVSTAFGKELDSLADLISFGLAPAFFLYITSLSILGRTGWLLSFFYLACGAIRLARFNILPARISKNFFIGLPIPMASCTLLWMWFITPKLILLHGLALFIISLLMISPFPYPSFKVLNIRSKYPTYSLLILLLCLFVSFHYPLPSLMGLLLLYLLSGPVQFMVLQRRGKFQALDKVVMDEF